MCFLIDGFTFLGSAALMAMVGEGKSQVEYSREIDGSITDCYAFLLINANLNATRFARRRVEEATKGGHQQEQESQRGEGGQVRIEFHGRDQVPQDRFGVAIAAACVPEIFRMRAVGIRRLAQRGFCEGGRGERGLCLQSSHVDFQNSNP